ncbi:MAG: hypothetical protein ACM3XR_08865 [Bacillota bacterium]
MELTRFKWLYLSANIVIIATFLILVITAIFLTNRIQVYYIGIASRMILGILCVFNSIWNACTNYYSIIKNNRFQKNGNIARWLWWLIFIVGVLCIITAFMGYGFNGVKKTI